MIPAGSGRWDRRRRSYVSRGVFGGFGGEPGGVAGLLAGGGCDAPGWWMPGRRPRAWRMSSALRQAAAWVLVRDFDRAGGEVVADVYCDGGAPRWPTLLLLTKTSVPLRWLAPLWLVYGLVVGVWSGTKGNPWPSAAATRLTAPLFGVGSFLGGLVEVPSLSAFLACGESPCSPCGRRSLPEGVVRGVC